MDHYTLVQGFVVLLLAAGLAGVLYWHSTWQHSVNELLAGHGYAAGPEGGADRAALAQGLETWDMQLHACIVPAGAPYAGQSLAALQIPARFGCFVVEVERNRHAIPQPAPDFTCFAGDKLLLLGRAPEIEKASAFLESEPVMIGDRADFDRAVLESFVVPEQGPVDRPLGAPQIARRTGVRVLGIARNEARILVPRATETLQPGDCVLCLGTLDQLRDFRSWLASKPHAP
jgi:CPA2 family monovalent cation:H+ antiporter-2